MGVSAMRRRKRGPSDSDSDSDYHDGDDEDFSAVSRKKSKPRKKLALPKHPKVQNSSRRDIKEHGRRVDEDAIDVVDSEDDRIANNKSQNFQTLLDAVFDNSGESLAPLSCHLPQNEGQTLVLPQGIKEGKCSSKQDTQENLCSEEEQDDQDEDYCIGMNDVEDDSCSEEERDSEGEDCHAGNSDGLERPKLKQKSNKNATPVALEPGKMDFMVTHVKAELSALKSKSSGKSASVKTPHSLIITKRFGTTPVGGLKNVPFALPGTRASLKSNKESSWESISSDSPNAKIMQYQSSLTPHQRVVGLSRRVRPAPLHPYLLKSDT